MDLGTLFTEQRWNILSALSKKKYSPLQLAEVTNTTMANISQQLKLLEISNLVTKEKVPNRDKGQPRSLFSLSDDYAYLVSSMKGFADKKLLKLDKFHRILLKVWFLDDKELQYFIEKFMWNIEEEINEIEIIVLKPKDKEIDVVIGSNNPGKSAKNIRDTIIKVNNQTKKFNIKVISVDEAEKLARNNRGIFSKKSYINVIYDPEMYVTKYIDD